MAAVAPTDDSSSIAFERHFNPLLKKDSSYFGAVGDLISCVERNSTKPLNTDEQNMVCSNEMKRVRMAAFKNELLYHNINKRFYMDLIQRKRGESAF